MDMFGKPDSFKVRSRAIIFHEKQLLVVKHHKDSPFYALPGGHLDHGEDPIMCLSRELEEELGVTPEVGEARFVHTFKDRFGKHCVEFFFTVSNASDFREFENNTRSHAHEIIDFCWVDKKDGLNVLPTEIAQKIFKGPNLTLEFIRS